MSATDTDMATRLDALHVRMKASSLAGHWQERKRRPDLVQPTLAGSTSGSAVMKSSARMLFQS